jgi:predicted dehydrogenase
VSRELVALGVPVLAETPPAADAAGLRALWAGVGGSGLVQVAEQYALTPGHAARLAVLRAGTIGSPTSVQLSSTHLHHAVSLIRRMLGVGYDTAEVSARDFVAPLVDPLTRSGWTGEESPRDATTTLASIDFGGRMGLYDFTDNQWRNPLRTRRVVIRGVRGEILDDQVVRLVDPVTVVRSSLARRQTGLVTGLTCLDLEHVSFDGTFVYRNPFAGSGLSDDDVAVADLAERTGAWARDEGPPPYPLAEACQDHLIGLAIGESARTGRPVTTTREAWTT